MTDSGSSGTAVDDTELLIAVRRERDRLFNWLFDAALPLWALHGVDRIDGGFYEKLTRQAVPVEEARRTRLVSRQIYVFATATELGWNEVDTAHDLVDHGLEFLLRHCITQTGTVHCSVTSNGDPVKPDFALYDHAFALFGLATSARLGHRTVAATETAHRMVDRMITGWKHPQAGFEESSPPTEPLNANEHMHLLESFLAWEEFDDAYVWRGLADEIAKLAMNFFIDPDTGGLREHFDHNWRPLPGDKGRLLEPGHQFEWSWLLWRWGVQRRQSDAFAKSLRLAQIGEIYGINPRTRLAVNGIWDDLSLRDNNSRLWPQTERIKANIAVAELSQGAAFTKAVRQIAEAASGLQRYFDTETPGLWHETLDQYGNPVPAPARASSLYHIVCALSELDKFTTRHTTHD